MKMIKWAATSGILFLLMKFSTMAVFNQMLVTSEMHQLPMVELVQYQSLIMKIVVIAFVIVGILFVIAMAGMARNAWRAPNESTIRD
ncbi:MAG: hypothetical protein K0Q73_7823 [Paenibacillus sp.]|jgi:hypothetical protein|uniref:hypothetical protein n=1 Tax=Paenibacillus sp. GCM10012303 TaxID=3317340 RepID=UPI0029E4DFCC|nr:hypothetical protein [Paenibacillus sp.]